MEDRRRKRLINEGGEKEVMKKKNNENGITLIALIITIIILVILAAVSIRAVYDMGIVNHAVNGTQKYAEEAVKENQMLEDTTSLIGDTVKKLNAIQGKVPDLLRRYVLGSTGTGRDLFEIFNMLTMQFIPEEDSITNPNEVIVPLNILAGDYKEPNQKVYMYIKYDNVAYKVTVDAIGQAYTSKAIEVVYVPKGMEGEIVGFKVDQDEDTVSNWLVLYDNGNTVDIVSLETMGDYEFNSAAIDVNDGINSYNNAVSLLNTYCASLIDNDNAQRVRSVGTAFDLSDTKNKYTSTFLENNPAEGADKGTYNGKGLVGDINCEQDVVRMSYYPEEGHVGYGYTYAGAEYWLASRYVRENSGSVNFNVRRVDEDGSANYYYYVWRVSTRSAYFSHPTLSVRPVVRVAKSALLAPSSN